MKTIVDCTVIENMDYQNGVHLLRYQTSANISKVAAGQFVEVRVDHEPAVFLRRPFSFCDVNPQNHEISLLIKKVGKGTRLLAEMKAGQSVNMILPLGNHFTLPENKNKKVLLIGGGSGIAPIFFLAKQMTAQNFTQVYTLLGFKDKASAFLLDKIQHYGYTGVTTEDGSLGEKGYVTHHSFMQDIQSFSKVYTCGPNPMMKSVSRIAEEKGIPCEVSLENTMACGFGVCLCCITHTIDGNKCVCTEGAVFDSKTLTW